jgi:coenzyme F420-reducing hydrogenase delta subunit/Pyruvate/2-oxoacid:ferredoxin oxidoreductase delta subunit
LTTASTSSPRRAAELGEATPVRGEGILRRLELPFLELDRLVERVIPARFNPFTQTGAIANTMLIIAIASGVLLLIWYSPSVNKAFDSVEAMSATPWTAGLVRSLHRYSSDACMFFVLLHAFKLFFARRIVGPRWIAWVTGILVLGMLWLVGWLGYWLVWDERGHQVALGSARVVDLLPMLVDPLEREFLVDETVNSLLFFVVFFVHMLVPLGMALGLWLHIVRLNRSKFITDLPMTALCVVGRVLLALAYPATSADEAAMRELPRGFTMDWWYLLPLWLTDRLSGGILWLLIIFAGAVSMSLPWLLKKSKPRPAEVATDSCNACEKCFNDCPYEAISMVARPEESKRTEKSVALVDPAKCLGCGICAGSCNTAGIGLDWMNVVRLRSRQDRWLEEDRARGDESWVAFVCAESAGADMSIEEDSGRCEALPGYRVTSVPCAGWVHALTVERAIRHGARGVMIAGCSTGACAYREGSQWTADRMRGERLPILRPEKTPPNSVRYVQIDRSRPALLRDAAKDFRRGEATAAPRSSGAGAAVMGAVLLAVLCVLTALPSNLPYTAPVAEPQLVVTFNHPGERGEDCRELSPDELAKRPAHMRQATICDRRRADVRVRVFVDGELVIDDSVEPGGAHEDGRSMAIERVPVPAGEHEVRVELGDTLDQDEYNHVSERRLDFREHTPQIVRFEKQAGFVWN